MLDNIKIFYFLAGIAITIFIPWWLVWIISIIFLYISWNTYSRPILQKLGNINTPINNQDYTLTYALRTFGSSKNYGTIPTENNNNNNSCNNENNNNNNNNDN
jgi:hypothetical protein